MPIRASVTRRDLDQAPSITSASTTDSGIAAANTVPTSQAGIGENTISGYNVTSVHYGLNTTDPSKIDSATFSLNTTPVVGSTIKIKLVTAGTTWYSCTNVTTAVTCVTTSPQATVLASDQLQVVVAD